MNARTLILILGVGLVGIGLVMAIANLFSDPPVEQTVQVAVAAIPIEPYTVITTDMLQVGEPMRARDATERGAYSWDTIDRPMSTRPIEQGEVITTANALPPEDVRFTEDLGLEVVSFAANADQMVGGKLRPGHIINLYGTGRCPTLGSDESAASLPQYCRGKEGENFTVLIEDRVWVVNVSSSGGPVTDLTPVANVTSGEVTFEGQGRERPANLVTVAVSPDRAFRIVDALGGQGMTPYVTLAASQTVDSTFATPEPIEATPAAQLPPDLALTATALWNILNATAPPEQPETGGGPQR